MDAIERATLQVLADIGGDRLTTTRVAERAGVSVGTLYRYYPDKHTLLSNVVTRHLRGITDAVTAAVETAARPRGRGGRPRAGDVLAALASGYLAAKLADRARSEALYRVPEDIAHRAGVRWPTVDVIDSVALALGRCAAFDDERARRMARVATATLIGPVQALVTDPDLVNERDAWERALRTMLRRLASPKGGGL